MPPSYRNQSADLQSKYFPPSHILYSPMEIPANIYFFKANNRNTRRRCETKINSKKHQNEVSDNVLMFLLLNLNTYHNFF